MNTAIITLTLALTTTFAQAGMATNGGFETGDTFGWSSFPSPSSIFDVVSDAHSGAWAGYLHNPHIGSGAVIKQANLGAGSIAAGAAVHIEFWAKGSAGIGGVFFAEFFSELDGGGVSAAEILGGAPIFLTDTYTFYSFDTFAGPDVSGGVTLQFGAITGAVDGSFSTAYIDDVVVSFVPAPGSAMLLGLGGLAATRRRR